MANTKSLILGILVGGTVSVAATLLSTPESGRDMRGRVKTQSEELKNLLYDLKDNGLQLKDQLRKTSRDSALLVKNLTEEMKKSVEEWKTTVEPHQDSIYEYLEQIETSLKELEDKVKSN
jgi:gas vesicle protein